MSLFPDEPRQFSYGCWVIERVLPENQRRIRRTWAVAVGLSGLVLVASIMVQHHLSDRLGPLPAFIREYAAIVGVCEVLVTVALTRRALALRTRTATLLAAAYCLSGPLLVAHVVVLTNSIARNDAFSHQAATWCWLSWQIAWAILMCAYALSPDRPVRRPGFVLAGTLALALLVVLAGIGVGPSLPHLLVGLDDHYSSFFVVASYAAAGLLFFSALVVLRKRASSLDAWIYVALATSAISVVLVVASAQRFTIGWYFSRAIGASTAALILVVVALQYWQTIVRRSGRVDELERRAAALETREAEFRALGEAIPQIVWTTRPDGYHEFFNQRWYRYTGLTLETSVDHQFVLVLHPDDVARTLKTWQHSLATGEDYRIEYRFRRWDGVYRWFLGQALPQRDGNGRIVRWFGTLTDIEDERRTSLALLANERVSRIVNDAVPAILWEANVAGEVTTFNRRWYDYTGTEEQLPMQVSLDEIWARNVHPEDAATMQTYLGGIAAQTSTIIENRLRSAEGVFRWHRTIAQPVRGDDNVVIRWAGVTYDIQDERDSRAMLEGQLAREYRASHAFQDAALPKILPSIPGLTFSAVYQAAKSEALVGGDWYDAFRLSDGRIVISVGDVIGNGLDAAVTMGAVRQAIRGAAQIYADPTAILDAADRALRSEQPDRIVTAFVGVLEPLTLTLAYASAGHPAPFIRANDEIRELSARGLPIGLRSEAPQREDGSDTITIPDDSLLVMYTDGLTEATRDLLEGERRLRQALLALDLTADDNIAATIRDAVLETSSIDDVAILALHITDVRAQIALGNRRNVRTRWTVDARDGRTIRQLRHDLAEAMRQVGATASEASDVEIVLGELLGNVVRHTAGEAEVALDFSGPAPVLHVLDRGPGFTYNNRLPRNILSESGRGLFIASALTQGVTVIPRPVGGSHAFAVLTVRNFTSQPGFASVPA